ncbi:class I SAM-dependent methyltransferase [Pseudomonas migulae]|uniref:class I SAM-dependent methyltransferase n=1 Tax=Pseudomonas migulae TaxID=78543 RepID=UPI00371AAC21
MNSLIYCCPATKSPLKKEGQAFVTESGVSYGILSSAAGNDIPVFISEDQLAGGDVISSAMYTKDDAEESYDNFLSWLFSTFEQNEQEFRLDLIGRLGINPDHKVLVTGCGLGDDLKYLYPILREKGELYAQDLSGLMVAAASRRMAEIYPDSKNLHLSVSNASALPFPDGYFDAAYHFGGINLFSDIPSAIAEMARVTKVGGRVLIGDEGVAPWLKDKEFGKIAIRNNALWASDAPLQYVPEYSKDVKLSWVLGNCFYIVDFTVSDRLPFMNIDLVHKGARGGSMRTRYFGQLEGVDPELKRRVQEASARTGKSASQWVEDALRLQLDISK